MTKKVYYIERINHRQSFRILIIKIDFNYGGFIHLIEHFIFFKFENIPFNATQTLCSLTLHSKLLLFQFLIHIFNYLYHNVQQLTIVALYCCCC